MASSSQGWRSGLSPRRGFTAIQARRESDPPVVLALDAAHRSLRLFGSALAEAMGRSVALVVLDYGETSLQDLLNSPATTPENRHLRALATSPHVDLRRVDDLGSAIHATISYCEQHPVSLLVVSADLLGRATADPELGRRVLEGHFDLLVVTDVD